MGAGVSIRHAVSGRIATITLDRPEKLNAITFAMRDRFVELLEAAGADEAVHVVVVQGAGRAFTAGVDVTDRPDLQDPSGHDGSDDAASIAQTVACWERIWRLPVPVVVKAHGWCVGWGLEIALHADVVVASEDCRFSYPSVANGSGLPDSSMTVYHLGPQWAKRLLGAGETIDGRTAERIGLVSEAVPADELDARTDAVAGAFAARPRSLLGAAKAVVNESVELLGRQRLSASAVAANARARRDPTAAEFTRRVREEGLAAAIEWRDRSG